MRVAGPATMLSARNHFALSLALGAGFDAAPAVLGYGADLKSTLCLLAGGRASISPQFGDLAEARSHAGYRIALDRLDASPAQRPALIAADMHPEYHSRKLAEARATRERLPMTEVQHHHAHIASCLAENGVPLCAPPVIGVALDGLGFGADGTIWGGEFLLADYAGFRRVACLKPVAMLGGELAAREPWRNTYAHLMAAMNWSEFEARLAGHELFDFLAARPRQVLDGMLGRNINSPLASSCGRLFDAVAGAVGICREQIAFEGEAAIGLQRSIDECPLAAMDDAQAYPFALAAAPQPGTLMLDPRPMWQALLGDLKDGVARGTISARFHTGLAIAIARTVAKVSHCEVSRGAARTVALSGGVFQNTVLRERVRMLLESAGFTVLMHRLVPNHDGGISLGQAAIAAARMAGKE